MNPKFHLNFASIFILDIEYRFVYFIAAGNPLGFGQAEYFDRLEGHSRATLPNRQVRLGALTESEMRKERRCIPHHCRRMRGDRS